MTMACVNVMTGLRDCKDRALLLEGQGSVTVRTELFDCEDRAVWFRV